jgi:hypothetical protein
VTMIAIAIYSHTNTTLALLQAWWTGMPCYNDGHDRILSWLSLQP